MNENSKAKVLYRYYAPRIAPKLIRLWLEKAPMIFLVIAAVAFVIGLNLFAYLSLQVRHHFLLMQYVMNNSLTS